MSTASTTVFELDSTLADRKSSSKGFFQRVAENRERQAEARIRAYLLGRSDAGLAKLGFAQGEIATVRATGAIPPSFWR